MLRLTKNCLQRSSLPFLPTLVNGHSAANNLKNGLFQMVTINQQQWLAARLQSTSTDKSDYNAGAEAYFANVKRKKAKDKEVTPLGWFLLLVPITTFLLGCWQVKRKAWKEQLIKDLEQMTQMPAVPLPDDLAEVNNMEYRLVTVRGKFLNDKEMLLGPRSFVPPDGGESAGGLFSQRDGGNGYLIVTPFKLADRDDIILINRGWVPRKNVNAQTRLEGQLDKEVELTGVVRIGETRPQFTPKQKGDIFLYRDLPKMCALTGAAPVFLDATYESSIPGGPIGGQTRVTLRNEHLSYLITWFSLSAATSYLWYRQIVKRKAF